MQISPVQHLNINHNAKLQKQSFKKNALNINNCFCNSLDIQANYNMAFTAQKTTPVYVFQKDVGLIRTLNSTLEAEKEYGIPRRAFYNGVIYIDNETVCVYGDTLQSQDENKQIYLDDKKVDKMFKELNWEPTAHDIYAIKASGEYFKFSSAKEAADALGVCRNTIHHIIERRCFTSGNYTFVRAIDFEIGKDRQEIDKTLYKEALSRFALAKKQAIYAIHLEDGKIEMHETPAQAALACGVSRNTVNSSISKEQLTAKNFAFIRVVDASKKGEFGEILLDKEGKPIPDKEKINKIRQATLDTPTSPVVGIAKDKSVRIFSSPKSVKDELNVSSTMLTRSLNGIPRESKGYAWVRLSDVILRDNKDNAIFDENNQYILDERIIEKIHKEVYLK